MNILFLGDISGRLGRDIVKKILPEWVNKYQPDIVIANGENSAGGFGITSQTAEDIFSSGVDVITLGNHTYSKSESINLLENDSRVIRPLNYPAANQGYGYGIYTARNGEKIAVINLLGRVFLDVVDNPFEKVNDLLKSIEGQCDSIFIDFHAEATSEKAAMAWMLDGRVTAVIGTHTHVQTADERVLPNGTAFLSDVGMCGAYNSILGVKPDIIVDRMLNFGRKKFEIVESGSSIICGVLITSDDTGKAVDILCLSQVF